MPQVVRFAYYCSGHGYGHATRVSAFASSLLSLDVKPWICVVSSAPSHVFSECISRGAQYRYIHVDPVIVQPLAYKVDRQGSVQVLQTFLAEKEVKLAAEVKWLLSEHIDCVLSDAAFLACEAATKACIPSILITNFTFDSVYSYLGAEIIDKPHNLSNEYLQTPNAPPTSMSDDIDDCPVNEEVLSPLVSQLLMGYRHADILILLPGFIPIPSFSNSITLPAPTWIDLSTNRFKPGVEFLLRALPTSGCALSPSIPFPSAIAGSTLGSEHSKSKKYLCNRKPQRAIKCAPLLVRPTSTDIHTPEGRSKLLSGIGIPENLHDPARTQILVVSFGGQKIRRPQGGKSPARAPTPIVQADNAVNQPQNDSLDLQTQGSDIRARGSHRSSCRHKHSRTATQIFIPGAPAAVHSPISPEFPNFEPVQGLYGDAPLPPSPSSPDEPSLLPSPSWIAIICGVSSNWSISEDEDEELPAGFYLAPPDVYMPDLTAVADVLMGKLGYGTVSECVASATPLVYVPRPLFVEEHGLRLFLEAEGVGVELSRHEYESGGWATKVEEAYLKGTKRERPHQDDSNARKVKELASWVVQSVEEWRSR